MIHSRRRFIKRSSAFAVGAPFLFSPVLQKSSMKCIDIHNHFRSTETAKLVNWERTTDTFKAGDPSKPVRKVAVAWKASWDALKEAAAKGADLFVSHESICVNAENGSPEPEVKFALPSEMPKFEWLEKSGLVVYRCHDVWDRFPEIGIRDTWQRELKLGGKIIKDEYPFYVTEVAPITLGDLAKHLLEVLKPLGQNGVVVTGDLNKKVSRIGTGTGQNNNSVALRDAGADVGIMTDDGYNNVRMGHHAKELGFPTIVVNHGVSEEWALRNLAIYLQKTFPQLEVFDIPQYCIYKIIV
jgi:putative NIF3 family GTP cyclohydrolase 1 type 2